MAIHALTAGPAETTLLAVHPRATRRGSWIIDPRHWDGLPDGTTRATTDRIPDRGDGRHAAQHPQRAHPLEALLIGSKATHIVVSHRPLATYDRAAGLTHRNDGAVS